MLSLGDMVKRSQPSLFWCMLGISKAQREAVFTVFAFCRHLNGILLSDMDIAEKRDILKTWREELDNIYDKKVPVTNIGRKIYKNCIRFDLPKSAWLNILDAATWDAENNGTAPTREEFDSYISGVSIMPLSLTLAVLNSGHPSANQELAKSLGQAVMITYILRSVKSDAKRNRVYLPAELLQKAGVQGNLPRNITEDKNLMYARSELAKIAESGFNKAERLLSKMNKTDTLSLRLIMNNARGIFDIMSRRGWEIISPKPKLGLLKRLVILYRTLFN